MKMLHNNFFLSVKDTESNIHYTRGITPERVSSGGAHLRCSASGQHSFEETSQQLQDVGDTVSNFTEPGIELKTFHANSDVFNH